MRIQFETRRSFKKVMSLCPFYYIEQIKYKVKRIIQKNIFKNKLRLVTMSSQMEHLTPEKLIGQRYSELKIMQV